MEIGTKFTDLVSYNQNMAKGLEDKLFFLEMLPDNTKYIFVDFGCADGTLINALHHLFPIGNDYIGFDVSETMIDLARTKMTSSPKNVSFTSDWVDVENAMRGRTQKKVLILSSVIHEVYSYGSEADVDLFWKRVLETGFDYICVRDMMVPSSAESEQSPSDWTNNIEWDANTKVSNLRRGQFVSKWGPLDIKKNALHYLLKYRWQINWEREVNENYFPIPIEEFLSKFTTYNLDYFVRFRVPFLDRCIKDDYGITIFDPDFTHIKAIFSKKSY